MPTFYNPIRRPNYVVMGPPTDDNGRLSRALVLNFIEKDNKVCDIIHFLPTPWMYCFRSKQVYECRRKSMTERRAVFSSLLDNLFYDYNLPIPYGLELTTGNFPLTDFETSEIASMIALRYQYKHNVKVGIIGGICNQLDYDFEDYNPYEELSRPDLDFIDWEQVAIEAEEEPIYRERIQEESDDDYMERCIAENREMNMNCDPDKERFVQIVASKGGLIRLFELAHRQELDYFAGSVPWVPSESTVKSPIYQRKDIDSFYQDRQIDSPLICLCRGLGKVRLLRDAGDNEFLKYLSNQSLSEKVRPQMDTDPLGPEERVNVKVRGDTILKEQREESKANPVRLSTPQLELVTTRQKQDFSTLHNRYALLDVIDWKSSYAFNTSIKTLTLPKVAVESLSTYPNFKMFSCNALWEGDIELVFKLNTNRFQNGILVASFVYDNGNDDQALYENVATMMQRDHVKLHAGSSNPGYLSIPYQAPTSMIWTRARTHEINRVNDMCSVDIRVLTPLEATGTAPVAEVSIYIALSNSKFEGLVYSQMDTVATVAKTMEGALNLVSRISNRDLPSDVVVATKIIPQATYDMSSMTNDCVQEDILRADKKGITPAIPTTRNELRIDTLKRIFGYINTFEWSTTDASGKLLFTLPAEPMFTGKVRDFSTKNGLVTRIYPPVSILSSCFGYWSGDLEIQLEFGCSSIYSGSLAIVTVPWATAETVFGANDATSFKNARASGYQEFSLQERTDDTVNIPYFSETRVRRQARSLVYSQENFPPSTIYVYVINKLVGNEMLPTTIRVNIYGRGAENLEFFNPVPPSFAVAKGIFYPPTGTTVQFKPGYRPVFSTSNRYLVNGSFQALTWYYSSVSDSHAELNVKPGKIYLIPDKVTFTQKSTDTEPKEFTWIVKYKKDATTSDTLTGKWMVEAKQFKDQGVVVFFDTKAKAIAYVAEKDPLVALLQCIPFFSDSIYDQYDNATVATFLPRYDALGKFITPTFAEETVKDEHILDWNLVENQMDSRTSKVSDQGKGDFDGERHEASEVIVVNAPIIKHRNMVLFGEQPLDLKDIMRRFQYYGQVSGPKLTVASLRDRPPAFVINNHPVRRFNEVLKSSSGDNRLRGGVTSLILSGFTFYRGGLRYKFFLTTDKSSSVVMFYTHKFDAVISAKDYSIEKWSGLRDGVSIFDTQYATGCLVDSVNLSQSCVLPYYQPNKMNYLSNCTASNMTRYYGLGKTMVWVSVGQNTTANLEILYCIHDDMDVHAFKGFPPMVVLSDIQSEIVPQIDTTLSEASSDSFEVITEEVVDNQGLLDSLNPFKTVNESAQSVAGSARVIQDVVEEQSTYLKTFMDKMASFKNDSIESVTTLLENHSKSGFMILLELLKMIASKDFVVMALCVVTILTLTFNFLSDITTQLIESISKFAKFFEGRTVTNQNDLFDVSEIASTLFIVTVGYLGLKDIKTPNWNNLIGPGLSVLTLARLRSPVASFLRSILYIVGSVWDYIKSYFAPKERLCDVIIEKDSALWIWMKEAIYLTADDMEDKIMSNVSLAKAVHGLSATGLVFKLYLAEHPKNVHPSVHTMFNSLNLKVQKLKNECDHRKVFSPVRYEPFCLWIGGDAGTGKSHVVNEIAEMFREESKFPGNALDMLSFGSKYYDIIRNPCCIGIDEIGAVSLSSDPQPYVQFLSLKSSALFNPPYSAIENKNRYINAPNIIVTSNQMSLSGLPGMLSGDAFDRRRDLLVCFKFKTNYSCMTRWNDDNRHIRDTMEHITITVHPNRLNVADEVWELEAEVDQNGDVVKTKDQVFMDYVLKEHNTYHYEKSRDYVKKLKKFKQESEEILKSDKTLQENLKLMDELVKKMGDKELIKEYQAQEVPTVGIMTSLWSSISGKHGKVTNQNDLSKDIDQMIAARKNHAKKTPHPLWNSEWGDGRNEKACNDVCQFKFDEAEYCVCDFFKYETAMYDSEKKCFFQPLGHDCSKSPVMVSGVCCDIRDKSMGSMASSASRLKYIRRLFDEMGESVCQVQEDLSIATIYDMMPDSWISHYKLGWDSIEQRAVEERVTSQLYAMNQGYCNRYERGADGKIYDSWTFGQKLKHVVKQTLKFLFNNLKIITSIGAMLIAFVTLYSASKVEPQMHSSGDFFQRKSNQRVKVMKVANQNNEKIDTVRVENISSYDSIIKNITNNSVSLYGCCRQGESELQNKSVGIGIYNRKVLIPTHYLEYWQAAGMDEVIVEAKKNLSKMRYKVSELKVKRIEGINNLGQRVSLGLCVIELPKSFPVLFKDIRKYIVSDSKNSCFDSKAQLLEHDAGKVTKITNLDIEQEVDYYVSPSDGMESYVILNGFSYDYSRRGLCGALLLSSELNTPIIGIHVAGKHSGGLGFSQVLCREFFSDEVAIEFVQPQINSVNEKYEVSNPIGTVFEGCIDKPICQPRKTKIIPSEIYGTFPVRTEPAPLSPFDDRLLVNDLIGSDPLFIGMRRRCEPTKEVNSADLEVAFEDVKNMILAKVKPIRCNIDKLTFLEAAQGFSNHDGSYLDGAQQIILSTSEGYPWIQQRPNGETGKRYLFSLENDKIVSIRDDLLSELEEKANLRKQGFVPNSIFTCCLKDARILKEKVKIPGKTRVFENSPVCLSIGQRQLFLDFIASYQSARLKAEHTLGINVNGIEWEMLYNKLIGFSPYILTGDYSSYGPRVPSSILFKVFEIIEEWYHLYCKKLRDQKIERKVMAEEIIHGLHLYMDLLFRPSCGLPSGNVMTTPLNSMANSIWIRVAYLGIAKSNKFTQSLANMNSFNKFIRMFHNGDDLIISVKSEIISWFNNVSLQQYFGSIGMRYTAADKGDSIVPYVGIKEAQYLKCHFEKRGEHVYALLDKTSIEDTANWVWSSPSLREASLLNTEQCVRLSFGHGPEYFNTIREKLQNAWIKKNVFVSLPSYDQIFCEVWG